MAPSGSSASWLPCVTPSFAFPITRFAPRDSAGCLLYTSDNLFRLPSGYTNIQTAAGTADKRSDRIEQTSAGANELWVGGRQSVAAELGVSRNDYAYYKFLDNTAWNSHLLWDWTGGGQWTGQVGVDHNRGLLDFAYTRDFAKDIVDSGGDVYKRQRRYRRTTTSQSRRTEICVGCGKFKPQQESHFDHSLA